MKRFLLILMLYSASIIYIKGQNKNNYDIDDKVIEAIDLSAAYCGYGPGVLNFKHYRIYKSFYTNGKLKKDGIHYLDQITDNKNRLCRTECYLYGDFTKTNYFYDDNNNIIREDKYKVDSLKLKEYIIYKKEIKGNKEYLSEITYNARNNKVIEKRIFEYENNKLISDITYDSEGNVKREKIECNKNDDLLNRGEYKLCSGNIEDSLGLKWTISTNTSYGGKFADKNRVSKHFKAYNKDKKCVLRGMMINNNPPYLTYEYKYKGDTICEVVETTKWGKCKDELTYKLNYDQSGNISSTDIEVKTTKGKKVKVSHRKGVYTWTKSNELNDYHISKLSIRDIEKDMPIYDFYEIYE